MHMSYVFAGITLAAVFLATLLHQMRQAILSLWVAGLGIGAIYLTIGAEFLAVIQWIISTLVTLSLIFFSVIFGEYNPPQDERKKVSALKLLLALFVGGGFAVVVGLGLIHLEDKKMSVESHGLPDLQSLGRTLTQDHLLSLELLGLILFVVLIGGGVITRFEGDDRS